MGLSGWLLADRVATSSAMCSLAMDIGNSEAMHSRMLDLSTV